MILFIFFAATRPRIAISIIFQSKSDIKRISIMEIGYYIPFLGNLGFNFFFNMIFTYRYCRMLEEGSFRGRTADFVVMFIFGGTLMIVSFLTVVCNRQFTKCFH